MISHLVIRNGLIITPHEQSYTDLWVEGEYITKIGLKTSLPEKVDIIDATNCYVTPALVDLQVNGGPYCNFWEIVSIESVSKFSHLLSSHGVGTILPTLITDSITEMCKKRDSLKKIGLGLSALIQPPHNYLVRMPGIHLEGPCISPQKPGVHPKEHIQPLSLSVLDKIIDDSIKLITLASECDKTRSCLEYLKKRDICVSLGHTNASFEEAQQSFKQGVTLVTHLFNAMSPIHHRFPGAPLAALFEKQVFCCIICDGLHVAPPVVELVWRLKGQEKIILVTDIASIGTSEGSLVGSSIFLDEAVKNIVNWGICSFPEAVKMASYNPSLSLGLANNIGILAPGAYADIVLWDRRDLSIRQVIFNGKRLS